MDDKLYTFGTDLVTVTWSRVRCNHMAACIRGLPEVFDPGRRPWIEPGLAPPGEVAEVVCRCPTGALHYERHDGGAPETPAPGNTVTLDPDGPLYLRGAIRVRAADGAPILEDTRVGLCRCGASRHEPVCDGTHWEAGFEDRGRLGTGDAAPADAAPGTPLEVTVQPGEPLWLRGPFVLVPARGEMARPMNEAWLCRCGRSKNKPFCDDSHKSAAGG